MSSQQRNNFFGFGSRQGRNKRTGPNDTANPNQSSGDQSRMSMDSADSVQESGNASLPNDAMPDISSSQYARKRKELMDLTSYLRSIGAGKLIEIPRIAVIGGQSAGKSSLVEAVSGISVPRDSGTCTRCPMEFTIASNSDAWSCKIYLQFDYDRASGAESDDSKRVFFGPEAITDKSLVEIWLRRAQVAILSPDSEPSRFYNKTRDELKTLMREEQSRMKKFERNKICIDIEDPDATDLTFVDLPGLIQNESDDMIHLIKSVVYENIKSSSTIILLTIPMSDDIQNQGAMVLAKDADPKGERTIGVLTKPDTLTSGASTARQNWKDIIEGRNTNDRLTHGYYCVRLPDDDERARGISRAEAERTAKTYLDSTTPWNEVRDRSRFGVPNLINYTSKLLMHVIEEALPKMKLEVQKLLAETTKELSVLPRPPVFTTSSATSEVLLKISKFTNDVRDLVYGGGDDKTLIQQNRRTYEALMFVIKMNRPDFRPFPDCGMYTNPFGASGNILPFSAADDIDGDGNILNEALSMPVIPMDLSDVREVIKSATDWQLPNHVPYEAKKILIKKYIDRWHQPALNSLDVVSLRLKRTMDSLVTKSFSQFIMLEDLIKKSILDSLDDIVNQATEDVLKALKLEQQPYYTQNLHYLQSKRHEMLDRYVKIRRNASSYRIPATWPPASPRSVEISLSIPASIERPRAMPARAESPPFPESFPSRASDDTRILRDLASLGYPNLTMENLERLYPLDDFQTELELMADVRAYVQVAYKRFIDQIPLTIEKSLNQAFSDSLLVCLYSKLNVGTATDDEMKELLSEDPEIADERRRLETKKAKLLDIQKKLTEFNSTGR